MWTEGRGAGGLLPRHAPETTTRACSVNPELPWPYPVPGDSRYVQRSDNTRPPRTQNNQACVPPIDVEQRQPAPGGSVSVLLSLSRRAM
jgi:hypothetical protein